MLVVADCYATQQSYFVEQFVEQFVDVSDSLTEQNIDEESAVACKSHATVT